MVKVRVRVWRQSLNQGLDLCLDRGPGLSLRLSLLLGWGLGLVPTLGPSLGLGLALGLSLGLRRDVNLVSVSVWVEVLVWV